jgi:HD-like signal output (HDOD) protein
VFHTRFEELKSKLPSSPGVGLAILRSTRGDDAPIDELVRCIEVDPALAGRLLRLANSRRGRQRAPVTTVAQAAERVGAASVRNLALGFTLVSSDGGAACRGFDYDRYWASSMASSLAARDLAAGCDECAPAEAFTAGLLGRIGRLALASVHAQRYAQILGGTPDEPIAHRLAAERLEFDMNHAEITAAMITDCGLPDVFATSVHASIVFSEETLPDGGSLAKILRAAAQVGDLLCAGRDLAGENLASVSRTLSTGEVELETFLGGTAREWRARCAHFGVRAVQTVSTAPWGRPERT